jgi:hypothetical protein
MVEKCFDIGFIVQQLLHIEKIIGEKYKNSGDHYKKINLDDYFSVYQVDETNKVQNMKIIEGK